MVDTFADRLKKLLPLLGSDKEGEVLAAVAAIGRTLEGAGADWHWLAAAIEGSAQSGNGKLTDFHDIARCVLDSAGDSLSPREAEFVTNMTKWRNDPSPLQREWLNRLARQWCEAAA